MGDGVRMLGACSLLPCLQPPRQDAPAAHARVGAGRLHPHARPPPISRLQRASDENGSPQLRLMRADAAEVAAWEAEQRLKRIAAIHEAAGTCSALPCTPAGPGHALLLANASSKTDELCN